MVRRPGELSPRSAAKRLECSFETVRRWCRDSLDGRRETPVDAGVRRDVTGHYWISESLVVAMIEKRDMDNKR